MKKADFVSLLAGVAGLTLFALGMCMCLVEEWDAFQPGVVIGAVGAAVLLVLTLIRRKLQGKPPVKLSRKTAGIIALSVAGALTLGVGMCMTMVWDGLLVWGVIVGLVGILLLLCLIPVCKGWK